MKYYIIAGEASGDLHASNLIKEIALKDPDACFRAWGGDLMQQAGATIVKHINELSFMGFTEVLLNIRTILGNIRFCKKDILEYKPDAVIFIDYPGFNLRIARFCKEHNIKTIYYISPQVWAWNKSRVKSIRRDVDKMLVILPFEKAFYDGCKFEVDFVGHPLLDALQSVPKEEENASFREKNNLSDKEIIAILPGSRKQEISRMLTPMVAAAKQFPHYQFVIAGTKAHSSEFYQSFMGETKFPILFGETYGLLQNACAALVTSGTATLETALIGTPQVVCYKAGYISYRIAKKLVDLKYISLVNLIMDEEVVRELIQDDCNSEKIAAELKRLTQDLDVRNAILEKYDILRQKLGGSGASEKAAGIVVDFVGK
jgi:lipid-A-disaccharide synthase